MLKIKSIKGKMIAAIIPAMLILVVGFIVKSYHDKSTDMMKYKEAILESYYKNVQQIVKGIELDSWVSEVLPSMGRNGYDSSILIPEGSEFKVLAKSYKEKFLSGLEPNLNQVFKTGKTDIRRVHKEGRDLLVLLGTLNNDKDKAIGISAVILDISKDVARIRKSFIFYIAVASVLIILYTGILYFLVDNVVSTPIKRSYETVRQMVLKGDLTQRIPMQKVDCSALRKCRHTDCPAFGKKLSCFQEVGSNAPGGVQCRCLTSGEFKSCVQCPVAQSVLRDELDKMAAWINTFVTRVGIMIKDIATDSQLLNNSSADLSSLSAQMSGGAEDMAGKSNTVASASEQMSSNMHSVASAMEEAATNIGMVASAAEEMTSTIAEIAQNSEKASNITSDAVIQTKSASKKVDELGNAAREIGKVVETITEISEQVNLLALNATIEAARAGEAGKGFAVVANEIKDLAKQTAGATMEIKEKIAAIQGSTDGTVSEINQISKIINDVNEIVTTIATAVEQQSVTTKEIAGNVAQASQGIQEVSENVAQSSNVAEEIATDIADVNQSAAEMSNSSAQVNLSAEELTKMGTKLNKMVGKFKISL
jgi:methyl-accepting chemotaxis protein